MGYTCTQNNVAKSAGNRTIVDSASCLILLGDNINHMYIVKLQMHTLYFYPCVQLLSLVSFFSILF